jgi:hypothetical protein
MVPIQNCNHLPHREVELQRRNPVVEITIHIAKENATAHRAVEDTGNLHVVACVGKPNVNVERHSQCQTTA